MKVTINIHGPGDDHQRRAGRHLPGHAVAPVRRGRPRPQLRVVEHDHGVGPAAAQHGPQRRPPDSDGAAWPAGRPSDKADRIKAYQQINQYLAEDIPYLWLARDTWAVVANPECAELRQPTTLQGSKAIAFDEGVLWPTQIWMS